MARVGFADTSLVLFKGSRRCLVRSQPQADLILRHRLPCTSKGGTAMGQGEGPSERLLLWTAYMLLVAAGVVALILLHAGHVVGEAGGSLLLGQVVSSMKTLRKQ